MTDTLTLLAVHAHPDDEAIGTGGILAKYADEGVRTVLVTCTNGELGDAPGGLKPESSEHDAQLVAKLRAEELRRACDVLGVSHLEMLGYHDSGMMGWPQNDAPHAFWKAPVEQAAARLAELFERYRPDVVVTYDENGFYGHPDHIQANRITRAALASTGIPKKLYYTALSKQSLTQMAQRIVELMPEKAGDWSFDPDDPPFGCDEGDITTVVDASDLVARKREAMAAHASQSDNMEFLALPDSLFEEMFGRESFIRVHDTTSAPLPETDLFAGLR